MSVKTVTKPPILDETGQDIVSGLTGIANAVQPINIYLDIAISIPVDGWSQTVPHRYTWSNARVTTECGVEVHFTDGAETVDMKYIEYEKVPGGIRFEIDEIPDKAVPLMVRIINASTTAVIDPIDASLVETSAVPSTSNVEEALGNHESRLSAAETDVDNIQDKLVEVDDELALRLKSVNGVLADKDGDVIVNETEFTHQIVTDDAQQSTGEFLFRTTGGDASLSDGPAMLVAICGRSVHTGEVAESIEMTVTPATREEGQDPITATIDRDTFVSYVLASGTTTLTFTDSWSADPANYGITVTGTPITGDVITVVYVKASRGTITVSNPNKFISTGWNLYNNADGKKYAKVKKYSTQYGFMVGGAYATLEFSETLNGSKQVISPVSGYFTVPTDGYIWVTGGDATTYIFMTWSDWTEGYEGEFQSYSETVVDLAAIMSNFSNGLFQVGAVHDEINFSMMRAISRIERLAYTAQNLEYAQESGRAYDADENYIYLVKDIEDVYVISTHGSYTASDHGTEIIEGGEVPVFVETLYGQNLVDKLRTDVVTKSQDIVNNLTSDATNKVLSAAMGKALNSNITALNEQMAQIVSANASSHNSIYRGKYLGSAVTSAQYAAISSGTFDDLFIGDYWTIGGVNWRIAGFDYWLNTGDTQCTTHHVVIVPDSNLYTAQMNTSNTTANGYHGSAMYASNLASAKTTINNAFGSGHILNHRELLSNGVSGNIANGWAWYDSTVELMNECMVYGTVVNSKPVADSVNFNVGIDHSQLPLFRHNNAIICNRANWWLRCVVSSVSFAFVPNSGFAGGNTASYSYGVRPAFGIH